jgi:hypothetical protein
LPEYGRAGQTQPVSVVKCVLEGSSDDRIKVAQDRKREFIFGALDGEHPPNEVES